MYVWRCHPTDNSENVFVLSNLHLEVNTVRVSRRVSTSWRGCYFITAAYKNLTPHTISEDILVFATGFGYKLQASCKSGTFLATFPTYKSLKYCDHKYPIRPRIYWQRGWYSREWMERAGGAAPPGECPGTMTEWGCFVVYHTNASANDTSHAGGLSTFLWQ